MIISHRHRYVFVEVPNTGSTAISRDLRELYGGNPVLQKHTTLGEFWRIASATERQYFVFGTVRHPLDAAVTEYFKFRTNHRGKYTDTRRIGGPAMTRLHLDKFRLVHDERADFQTFFLRYKTCVYNNYYLVLHAQFDRVMRFETLQDDFAATTADRE
jgi:Sulfotransferase family